MKELKAPDKVTQKMTHDGAVAENLSTGEVTNISSREAETDSFFATFGSLFYLGIILSAVFISAAVLIIYYKQISEGYEDQARFGIMRKVGMTKKEIRKSINSQLLTEIGRAHV